MKAIQLVITLLKIRTAPMRDMAIIIIERKIGFILFIVLAVAIIIIVVIFLFTFDLQNQGSLNF